MRNPFKKPDDDDLPFYMDESIIKDFERSIEMSKEILKNEESQMELAKRIKAVKSNPTPEQSDIDDLRIRMCYMSQLETEHDMIATSMHIQSLKAIVALGKVIESIKQKLPVKETKELVSKLDEVKNETSQTKEEMKKMKENVEKQLDEAKNKTGEMEKSLREVEYLKRQHDDEIKEADEGKK